MKKRILLFSFALLLFSYSGNSQNWTGLNGSFGTYIYDIQTHTSGAIVIASFGGIYRSTDAGLTWSFISTGTSYTFYSLDMDSTGKIWAHGGNIIYSSIDGGLTWTNLNTTGLNTFGGQLKVAPNGTLFLSYNTSLFNSTDGGKTFPSSFTFASSITDVDIASNGNILVSTQGSGVQISTTGGASFVGSLSGLSATANVYSLAMNAVGSFYYALASDGPYRSSDGRAWVAIKNTITDAAFIGQIEVDAADNLYINNNTGFKIYTSTNPSIASAASIIWSAGVGVGSTYASNCSYFKDANTWITGNYFGLNKTINGGTVWSSANQGIYMAQSDIAYSNSNLFVALNANACYVSSNDGSTWSLKNLPSTVYGFLPLNDNSIIAYGSGIYRSSDAGTTWVTQSSSGSYSITSVLSNGVNIYYLSGTTLATSINQGVSFTNQTITGLPVTYFLSGFQTDGTNFYALANNAGLVELYKITGTTATNITTNTGATNLRSLQYANGKLYTLTTTTLLSSLDGGITWNSSAIPIGSATNLWAANNNVLFVQNSATTGSAVTLLRSSDGGNTWVSSPLLDAGGRVSKAIVSPNSYGYLAVNRSKVHKSKSLVVRPKAPTSLASIGRTSTIVDLIVNDPAGNNEKWVRVERSTGNNTAYDSIGTLLVDGGNFTLSGGPFAPVQGKLPIQDFGAAKNTTYFYRVAYGNSAGLSAYSNEISVTTLDVCVSAIPDNRSWTATVNVTSGPNAGSTFTNAAAKITSIAGNPNNYTLYNYTFGAIPSSIYTATANQNVNFVETCGEAYFGYTLYAEMNNGNGSWNATTKTLTFKWQTEPVYNTLFQATTTLVLNATDPAPAAPTGVTGFVYSSTGASLNWAAVGFETSYVVERSTTSGSGFTTVGTLNYPTTNFIDKNLTTGTTYYYRIKAQNATGVSPVSVQLSITPNATLFTPVDITSDLNLSYDQQQGAVWGDLDGDGYDDLILPSFTNSANQAVLPSFYQNNGGTGQFTKKTIIALAGEDVGSLITRGIQLGDIDNDGDLDLFLARASNATDLILVNNGNWTFTKQVSNATKDTNAVWKTASFVDFDKDGKLDIFVGFDNNFSAAPLTPVLLKNNGGNSFVPVTTGPLVTTGTNARDHGWADYDNDGDLDVLVFNSSLTPGNRLFKNNGDGTFSLVTGLIFDTDIFANARTSSWGDIDNDGDLDLYIGSSQGSVADRLYLNSGTPNFTFSYLTTSAVAETGTATYGSTFGDIDNDGDLDLIAINQSGGGTAVFLNGGTGTFTKSTSQEFLTDLKNGAIGGALGDFDNNGFLDFYAGRSANTISPNFLLKNTKTVTPSSNWLKIKLIGINSNKAAIGARITVLTTLPSRTQIREISSHTGYGSMSSQVQHVGLGSATSASQISVRWPSGKTQIISTATTANQLITITEDTDGPLFKTLTPATNSTNASTAATLKVEMSEASSPVASKKINLYLASNLTTVVASIDVTTGVKAGEIYTYTLSSKLAVGSAYVVSIDAGAFVDSFGNSSLALATPGWTFTTGTGPSITVLLPTNGGVSVNANSTLDITFSSPVTTINGKTINLFKGTTTTPSYTLQATAGTITGNKVSFPLTPKLDNNASYSVAIDAGAFLDNQQNEYSGLPAANWKFTTSTGPDIDVLLPAAAATGISISTTIEITFKQLVTAVAGKKLQVKDGTATLIDIDVSTKGTITGNKYVFAPTAALPYLKQLEVVIQAGAFIDANQNDYKGTTAGQWTFTTVESPDVTPPTIAAFTPLVSFPKNFSTQSLALTVTDNKAVTSVILNYRKVSATTVNTLPGVAGSNNVYSFALQNSFVDDMGMEYYFEAVDAVGNKSRSPAAANSFHLTRTAFNNTNVGIPVSAGGTVNDYQIVSVPFDLPSKQVQFVFQDLGQPDKIQWRLLRYQNSPAAWIDYPASDFTNVAQGEGYFVNSRAGANLLFGDKATPSNSVIIAPNNTQSSLFTLNLKKGWNLIGNPYSLPIVWNDSRIAGVGALKTYQNGTYSDAPNNGQLDRLRGGFVLAESNIEVPVKLNTSPQGGRQSNVPVGGLDSQSWIIGLRLEQGNLINSMGGVGMASQAKKEKDDYDDVNPPRIGDYLEMHFAHPDYFLKTFSRDVVPIAENFSWTFTVESSLSDVTVLRWDKSQMDTKGKDLFLLDKSRQQLINMSVASSYTFNPKESSSFKLYFGSDLKDSILPSDVSLSTPYPNPSTKDVQLGFTLPDGSWSYDVNLLIFDLQGRLIETLVQGSFAPGFYESFWTAPETGSSTQVYICKLEVNCVGSSKVISRRIIIER